MNEEMTSIVFQNIVIRCGLPAEINLYCMSDMDCSRYSFYHLYARMYLFSHKRKQLCNKDKSERHNRYSPRTLSQSLKKNILENNNFR